MSAPLGGGIVLKSFRFKAMSPLHCDINAKDRDLAFKKHLQSKKANDLCVALIHLDFK